MFGEASAKLGLPLGKTLWSAALGGLLETGERGTDSSRLFLIGTAESRLLGLIGI